MRGHQTPHAYARAASEPTQRNSFSMFLLPACGRMGEALHLAIGLDPGVCWTAALLFGGAKDRCLSPISAQTEPAPLDGEWVPFAGVGTWPI
jgi:hypothetical protein